MGRKLREFLLITFGAIITATAVYLFMMPSGLAVGSASALALVLSNFIPLPVSAIAMIINVGLLLLGFLLLGGDFGIKTVYTSILVPIALAVYEWLLPGFRSITGDAVLDAICYILVVGVGLALLFSCNASSGGLDIVAKLMNKYLRLELGKAMSLSGMLVAVSSIFCADPKSVVISILATYFGGLIVDHFIFGMNIKRRVCIISPKLEQITDFILHDLHSGATIYEGVGAYDNTPRREIITIVDNQEYKTLMDYLKRTDPTAFITVYAVSAVRYTPKK